MENTTPISYIMTRKPVVVHPGDSLDKVRELFEKRGFHHAPVVENDKLIGIVSYTDYLRGIREVMEQSTHNLPLKSIMQTVKVKDIMTTQLTYLAPFDTVEDALRVFHAHNFHAIPVVEGRDRLVGILSTHDLIKVLEKVLAPEIDYAS